MCIDFDHRNELQQFSTPQRTRNDRRTHLHRRTQPKWHRCMKKETHTPFRIASKSYITQRSVAWFSALGSDENKTVTQHAATTTIIIIASHMHMRIITHSHTHTHMPMHTSVRPLTHNVTHTHTITPWVCIASYPSTAHAHQHTQTHTHAHTSANGIECTPRR